MKTLKHLNTIVKANKIECYYFKRADLRALFELHYKVDNIHIGYDWEYSGITMFNIPNNNSFSSKPDVYDEWSDRLTDMFNEGVIPKGTYLIESDYYCDGCG